MADESQRVCLREESRSDPARFKIDIGNVETLLRLADKFEIEYLFDEIRVSHGSPILISLIRP